MEKLHPMDAYFYALGRFINKFAEAESWLLIGLQRQAGVDVNTARAIFSGTRVDTAKSYVNRLREIKNTPDSSILDRAFGQLALITTMRNDIVHYGARFQENWKALISNSTQAMPGRERESLVTPEVLWAMIADLDTIIAAMIIELVDPPGAPWTSRIDDAQKPWQYKPTLPAQSQKPRRGSGQARKARP